MPNSRRQPQQSHHPHHPDSRHLLLDPRFLIQIATILLSVAGFAWRVESEVRGLAKDQAATARAIEHIQQRLPNNEAWDLRVKQTEEKVAELALKVTEFDGWVRITREQLAARGFKP